MNVRHVLGSLSLCFMQNTAAIAAEPMAQSNQVVVVGRPVSADFVELLQPPKGEVWMASRFDVVLKDVRVVAGEYQLPRNKRLTIELIADSSGVFLIQEEIYVLFSVLPGGELDSIKWDIPRYEVCISDDL
jgi:hypothetical protein